MTLHTGDVTVLRWTARQFAKNLNLTGNLENSEHFSTLQNYLPWFFGRTGSCIEKKVRKIKIRYFLSYLVWKMPSLSLAYFHVTAQDAILNQFSWAKHLLANTLEVWSGKRTGSGVLGLKIFCRIFLFQLFHHLLLFPPGANFNLYVLVATF